MFLFYFLVFNALLLGIVKLYSKLTIGICRSSTHLVGKVALVTGANRGIGLETARDLAERGARVLLACRSETRAREARDYILRYAPDADVQCLPLDLSSLSSVREFARRVLAEEKRLDILINNAGAFALGNKKTEDGLLLGMQVNHFGPFLLTCLLLPLLKKSAPSRIVNVSSALYTRGKIVLDNLCMDKPGTFQEMQLYSNSKLCNVLMSLELSKRLEGTGVTSNSLHPGAVETDIIQNISNPLYKSAMAVVSRMFYKTVWEGAQTQIYLAVAPELQNVSGRYFSDCRERNTSLMAQDRELARKLWIESEKLVKIKDEENLNL